MIGTQLETLSSLQLGNEVVAVRVEPLGHLQRPLLVGSAGQAEVVTEALAIDGAEARRDRPQRPGSVEDMVVETEVAAGDYVDSGCLGSLPIGSAQGAYGSPAALARSSPPPRRTPGRTSTFGRGQTRGSPGTAVRAIGSLLLGFEFQRWRSPSAVPAALPPIECSVGQTMSRSRASPPAASMPFRIKPSASSRSVASTSRWCRRRLEPTSTRPPVNQKSPCSSSLVLTR